MLCFLVVVFVFVLFYFLVVVFVGLVVVFEDTDVCVVLLVLCWVILTSFCFEKISQVAGEEDRWYASF